MTRIAVALDVASRDAALGLVDALGPDAELYKVGLELFSRDGPAVVRELRERGKDVFLDLKLHDIPNTVAGAVDAIADADVEFLTVHVTGGTEMLRAAAEAADGRVRLLGVTILTSLGGRELGAVWDRELESLQDEVLRLAGLAADAGLDGVVASALEVEALKRRLGADFLVATPGIRLAGEARHDHARVATPARAVEAGSDVLVVGRAVTAADDVRAAFERVASEARDARGVRR